MKVKGLRFLIALACLFGLATSPQASEQSVQLEGETINYSLPDGYCLLDPENQPFDKIVWNSQVEAQKGLNIVLRILFLCEDLKKARSFTKSSGFTYSMILAPTPIGGAPARMAVGQSNAQLFDQIRPNLNKGVSDQEKANLSDRINSAIKKNIETDGDVIDMQSIQRFGVLDEDKDALYEGMMVSMKAQGTQHKVAAVISYFPIKNYVLTYNIYRSFTGKDTYVELVDQSKLFVSDIVGRN